MKVTFTILLVAITLISCSKSDDLAEPVLPVEKENIVPGSIEEVMAAVVGLWVYEGETNHYVRFSADGVRCIGYSPHALDECMKYEIRKENGEYQLYIYNIGSLNDTEEEYDMVVTIKNLNTYEMQYQSNVYRSLKRIE